MLANLFLHYVFDKWMGKTHPKNPWARYADDGIVHCISLEEAKALQEALETRFAECKLQLNLEKTKIVYCKDDDRKGNHEETNFDFLGYTFRPRRSKMFDPIVRGWINYYGHFYKSALYPVMRHMNNALVLWVRRKFKKLERHSKRVGQWLGTVALREPKLFSQWRMGVLPTAG